MSAAAQPQVLHASRLHVLEAWRTYYIPAGWFSAESSAPHGRTHSSFFERDRASRTWIIRNLTPPPRTNQFSGRCPRKEPAPHSMEDAQSSDPPEVCPGANATPPGRTAEPGLRRPIPTSREPERSRQYLGLCTTALVAVMLLTHDLFLALMITGLALWLVRRRIRTAQ